MLIFFFSLFSSPFSSPLFFFLSSFLLSLFFFLSSFSSHFFSADPNPCADIYFWFWCGWLFWRCGVVGCWLGFCGRGGLCALEGWRLRLGLVAGWVLLWRWLGVWCWCWVWCFGGGGVRVFNVSVLGVCVCVCVSCGGWCVLAAVVVLVGVRRVGRYRYCRARVHVACDTPPFPLFLRPYQLPATLSVTA